MGSRTRRCSGRPVRHMSSPAMKDFPIVHAVTDSGILTDEDFLPRALSIMRALGSRGALHLRSSKASGQTLHRLASALAVYQRGTGCWLIVNDRVDIAAAVGARGVQDRKSTRLNSSHG